MGLGWIGQRLFDLASALSLLLCLACIGLWARSLGHFERVDLRSARWTAVDEVHTRFVGFSWYASTLRLEVIQVPFRSADFHGKPQGWRANVRGQHPPGMRWEFLGDNVTREMNGYPPGFALQSSPYTTAGVTGTRWVCAMRPWLPTLLTALLPALWLYRARTREGRHWWQFGVRDLFFVVTALAILLGAVLWLKG